MAVNISQKAAANQSQNVFFRGTDVVFRVQLHDPSGYLKTAAAIDYIWDFRDGNQLVTHRSVITHAYSRLGAMDVKLVVEAAFPVECPPTSAPPTGTRVNVKGTCLFVGREDTRWCFRPNMTGQVLVPSSTRSEFLFSETAADSDRASRSSRLHLFKFGFSKQSLVKVKPDFFCVLRTFVCVCVFLQWFLLML